jgi:hypothetical protein
MDHKYIFSGKVTQMRGCAASQMDAQAPQAITLHIGALRLARSACGAGPRDLCPSVFAAGDL